MTALPLVLTGLHKNLQRLSSMAIACSVAPDRRSTSLSALAASYAAVLQAPRRIATDEVQRVMTYLSDRALIRKYAGTNAATSAQVAGMLARGDAHIEMQDWWLSDPRLPSSTGAEREQGYSRTIVLCRELGLLEEPNLLRQSPGELLVAISREGFGRSDSAAGGDLNPFLPNAALSMAALYYVFKRDFVFQRSLLAHIGDGETSFTGLCESALVPILESVQAGIPNTPSTRPLQAWTAKQLSAARALEKRLSKTSSGSASAAIQTLFRPFEDMLLPRLEFLVDARVLAKAERHRYVYSRGALFVSMRDLLQGSLDDMNGTWVTNFALEDQAGAAAVTNPDHVLAYLVPGYNRFKGISAYAPIEESVLYSNALVWSDSPRKYLEVGTAFEALRQLVSRQPPTARIVADRFRRPQVFSIVSERRGD